MPKIEDHASRSEIHQDSAMPGHASKKSTFFLLAGALIALNGCGPARGDLQGKVTYQGKPLCSGSVLVAAADGVKASPIQADGRYEVKDIPVGLVKVTVNSPDPAGVRYAGRRKEDRPPPAPKDNSNWFAIPSDFGDFEKSGLTFQVNGGHNRWDIDLK